MQIPAQNALDLRSQHTQAAENAKPSLLHLSALTAIVLLAASLRLTNLNSLGLANHYYAAAVKSMLESLHNFFFVAAEPGGSVSVDKPPLGLWLQALSAKIFGVTTFGLLLPQLLAGLLSVLLIYYLVKRQLGVPAGLLAALVLAITPITVATDRNNTIDSTLIFTLLLAAWAFIRATETSCLRYLILGAVLVGIGFNIKMLEAYLPLPAFLALYFLGAHERWWLKIAKLLLAAVMVLVVSFSWAVAVDLTPADQRPYVGSSGDNSEMSLILGYNGVDRLLGMFGRKADRTATLPNQPGLNPPVDGFFPPDQGGVPNNLPANRLNNPNRGALSQGQPPSGPTSGTGQPGALRLFIPPLSKEASWLLPIALFSMLLFVISRRWSWPVGSPQQTIILWGGWLLTAGIFFSVAGFFHEYYLSTLAPPLAALVGVGWIEIWRMAKVRLWLAGLLLVVVSAITLVLQYKTSLAFLQELPWLPLVAGLFTIGAILIIGANFTQHAIQQGLTQIGFPCLIASLLVTPAIWSVLTNLHPSNNQSLPAAYDGTSNGPADLGQVRVDTQLLNYLQSHTQGVYYLMAVPSSMQGADYILATGRPVLYMGGFVGQDEVLTPESLSALVNNGKLRYIYWNASADGRGGGMPFGGQSLITGWVSSHCSVIKGFDTLTRNFGTPDGMYGDVGNGVFPGDTQPMILYDCGK